MDPWTYINISPSGDKHSGILHAKKQQKKINIQAIARPKTISKVKVKRNISLVISKMKLQVPSFNKFY